jgi:hypothetical protein
MVTEEFADSTMEAGGGWVPGGKTQRNISKSPKGLTLLGFHQEELRGGVLSGEQGPFHPDGKTGLSSEVGPCAR